MFLTPEEINDIFDAGYKPHEDALDAELEAIMDEMEHDSDYHNLDDEDDEYDGQPDEYTEWQDVYDGDDWDHGQYDEVL